MWRSIVLFSFLIWNNLGVNVFANEVRSLTSSLDYCATINPEVSGYSAAFRCRARAYSVLRDSTKYISLKALANNGIFVNEQMGLIFDDIVAGKFKNMEEIRRQTNHLLEINKSIYRDALNELQRELSEVEANSAGISSMKFIDGVLTALAGQKREVGFDNSTYVLNGRLITCNRFGVYVNCR